MARNYQAKEAFDIIKNRLNDPDTYVDFVRKFPGFAGAILSGDIETLCKGIPFGSARQFDKSIWDLLNGNETEATEGEADEDDGEEEAPAEKPAKGKGKGKAKQEEPEEDEGDGDDDEEAEGEKSKYDGMSPKKLFTLCQEAGLKVKEKQDAAYYIEKLEYADKKKGTGKKAAAEADDDWDEEEKPAKGKGKGKGKKEESDDEDWDF